MTSSLEIGTFFEEKQIMLYYGIFLSAVKLVLLNIKNISILLFYCDSAVLEILTDHKFQWPQ